MAQEGRRIFMEKYNSMIFGEEMNNFYSSLY